MAQEHLSHAFISATCPASYTQGHRGETSYLQKVAHLYKCVWHHCPQHLSEPSHLLGSKMKCLPWVEAAVGYKEKGELPVGGAPHCPLGALEGQLSAPHACYLLLRRACRWKAVFGMKDTGLYLAFPKHSTSLHIVVLPLVWDGSASPPQRYLPNVSFRLPWWSFLVVNK